MLAAVAAEAQPFFQLDRSEGEEADGDDVEPGFGSHGGGVEMAVQQGQVGKRELRQPRRMMPAISQGLEKRPMEKIERVRLRQFSR